MKNVKLIDLFKGAAIGLAINSLITWIVIVLNADDAISMIYTKNIIAAIGIGVFSMVLSKVFYNEHPKSILSSIYHMIFTFILVFCFGLYADWVSYSKISFLQFFLIFIFIYIVIYVIMFLYTKRKINAINKILKK